MAEEERGERGRAPMGRFVWHDLMTTDVEKAAAFYTALLPWTLQDTNRVGWADRTIHAVGVDQGGIAALAPGAGTSSHWLGYVAVEDVGLAVEAAQRHGGRAPGTGTGTDFPGLGRFAVVIDPMGAVIAPFRLLAYAGAVEASRRPAVGTFCWDELLALDPEGEAAFLGAIFGWVKEDVPIGELGTYHLLKKGNRRAAGMLPKPADSPGLSLWIPYVEVDDIDATAARVPGLGGQVYVKPRELAGFGRFAVLGDPTGAVFGLLRSDG